MLPKETLHFLQYLTMSKDELDRNSDLWVTSEKQKKVN